MSTPISILVIDDDPNLCAAIKRGLEVTGHYRVLVAESGKTDLALARKHHPDVILLDMMMPQVPGPEVARALRNGAETTAIPYIFLTGMLGKEDAASFMGATPGEMYLAKPASMEEIMAAVDTALRRANAEKG